MKNLKGILMLSAMVGLFFTSCKKEDFLQDEKSSLTSESNSEINTTNDSEEDVFKTTHGYLKFENREVFENYLEMFHESSEEELATWNQSLNFESSKLYWATQINTTGNLNSMSDDDLLLSILDKDGLVQIGEGIYKIQSNKELCWTLGAQNYSFLKEFRIGNFIPEAMNVFNSEFDGDVYEEMEKGTVGVDQSELELGQKEAGVIYDDGGGAVILPSTSNPQYKISVITRCKRLGIYHTMDTRYRHYKRSSVGVWLPNKTLVMFENHSPTMTNYAWCVPKDRSAQTKYPTNPQIGVQVNRSSITWRPYRSTRILTEFNMGTRFAIYDKSSGTWKVAIRNVYD